MNQAILSEICEINPPIDANLNDETGCSFVPMEYVDDISGTITNTTIRRVGEVKRGYTFFKNGDVIFAKITPCMENGKCAIGNNLSNGIAFGSTEFHVVRAKKVIIPEWIYYFLRQEKIRKQATHWFRGTAGQQRVPSTFLEELKIPLPPLDEQRRIAEVLGKADRLRRLRRVATQLGEGCLQSVFMEMFGDGIYDVVEFEEVVKIDRTSASEKDRNTLPYIGLEDIEKDKGDFVKEFKPIAKDMLATNFIFTPNHVLYGKLRPYLNKVVMPSFIGVCTTEILPLLPNPDKVQKAYLWGFLRSRKFIEWASNNVAGANLPRLSPEYLKEYPLPIPPLRLQVKFTTLVRRYERLQAQAREAERQGEMLFQSLLTQSYGGDDNGR